MLNQAHKGEIQRQLSMTPSMPTNKLLTALFNKFPSTVHKTKLGRRAIKGVTWDNVYKYQMAILPEVKANAETALIPTHIEMPALPGYRADEDKEHLLDALAKARAMADAQVKEAEANMRKAHSIRTKIEELVIELD